MNKYEKSIGYLSCKYWIDKGLWHDLIEITDPLKRGEHAVSIFLKDTASEEDKTKFIEGWDYYLDNVVEGR